MLNIDKKLNVFLILLVIILFHIVNNYIWLKSDETYLIHDSHHHFLFSLGVFNEIRNNLIPLVSNILDKVVSHHRWHGIFVGYITAPFYFIFGTSQDAGVMINNSIFLLILIFSTYGIGKNILNKKVGLYSAFIVSMYPLIFNHLRIYMLDLALTAMVSLSIYLLIKTEFFSHKMYTLLFAISFALGMLTKFTFIGFVMGPLVLILFNAFTKTQIDSYRKKTISFNVFIALCVIFIISFSFFKLKFWEVFARFYECSWIHPLFSSAFKSFFSFVVFWILTGCKFLLWSIQELMNNILSFFFFTVFFISLISFRKKKVKCKKILYLWIFLPILFLSFFFHYPNIDRYLMPLLPAIAIISGIGIASIKYPILRKIIILSVVLFSVFQFFAISYNLSFLPERIELQLPGQIMGVKNKYFNKIVLFHRDRALDYRNGESRFFYPSSGAWPAEEILREILGGLKDLKYKAIVFFIDNIPELYEPMEYISYVKNYPIDIYINSLSEEEFYKDRDSLSVTIAEADYVIMVDKTTTRSRPISSFIEQRVKHSKRLFEEISDCFQLLKKFRLPDGNNLLLFKNKKDYTKLETSSIRLHFRGGLLKLYFKECPMIKPALFGGSFQYEDRNYQSTQARWDIESSDQNTMIATARWQDSPVLQRWQFNILNNREIVLNIQILTEEEAIIDNSIFFFVVPPNYKKWKTQGENGRFSERNVLDYKNIILLPETEYIMVSGYEKSCPPAITFFPVFKQFNILPAIKYKKDRRIISFMINKGESSKLSLLPGEYDFLSFKISLTENNIETAKYPKDKTKNK